MLPLALGNGVGVLVAQAVGGKRFDVARSTGLTGIALAAGLGLIVAFVLIAGASAVTIIYTEDGAVRAVTATLLVLVAVYHVFDAIQAVTVSALRGYKRAVVPMVISAMSLWGVGLAGGYVLGLSDALNVPAIGLHTPLGAAGFWAAAIAGLALAFGATIAYYLVVSAPHHASAKEAGVRKPVGGT